jgi:ketosteroid isomerase-like protein
MSQENVEVVRKAFEYEYFGAGGPAEAAMYFTEDFEMNPTEPGSFEEERTVGRDSIRRNFERWASAWESLEVSAEDFVDAGDRVVVTIHHAGRAQGSGADIEASFFAVYTLRGGKVARVDEFLELADALEAAGLSE